MKNGLLGLMPLAALALAPFVAGAQYSTTNRNRFDDQAPGTGVLIHEYIDYHDSYVSFTPVGPWPQYGDFAHTGTGLSGCPQNGTAYLQGVMWSTLAFRYINGMVFDLLSVDLAEYSTVFPFPATVQFVGYRRDGSIVSTNITTDGIIDGTGPLEDFQTFYFGSDFSGLDHVEIPVFLVSLDNVVLRSYGYVPDLSNAAPILCGQTVKGTIGTRGQAKTYTFDGLAGEVVTLGLSSTSTNLAAVAELWGPGGTFGRFSAGETWSTSLRTNGTHVVLVHDEGYSYTGEFGLCLSFATGRCGTSIVCGQMLSNVLKAMAQIDAYTFAGTAQQAVALTLSNLSSGLSIRADLYDSAGHFVTGAWEGAVPTVVLPTNGFYTVLVHDYTYTNTGSYMLWLRDAHPRLGQPVRIAADRWGIPLDGISGQFCTLLATTNVALPASSWFTLWSGKLSGDHYPLVDWHATNQQRYYRIRVGR